MSWGREEKQGRGWEVTDIISTQLGVLDKIYSIRLARLFTG